MENMQARILLSTLNSKYIHMNLAIRILYDLNHEKHNLDWKEFTIKSEHKEIVEYCIEYDVVCFSCYIWNITQTIAAAKAIKAAKPNIKILLGGPEVSYEWENVIAEDCIDYIITGEGEIPFKAFVEQYPNIENVPNLIYKNEQFEIHYNRQAVFFDIEELVDRNPYQYDPPEDLKRKISYIETSRGCPYKCEFCLASLDNKVRYLDNATIKNNLKYLMDNGRIIKFLDRTFNIKKDFTIDMFSFILENRSPDNVFQFEITADIVHKDIIAFIQEKVPPNIFRFEIGVQTVNQESNREVGRKQNFTKTSDIINQLKDKIIMHLDLIVGLPLEDFKNLKYSFEETFLLYPPELQFGFLKFLKGTPLREKYREHGYVFDPNPPYEIIRSDYLSEEELELARKLEKSLEIYWNKKRAIHSLRYVSKKYSIFDFLLDLGIYFGERHKYHKHSLNDIYTCYIDFIKENYKEDTTLLDLAYIDYYLYNKLRPQDIFSLELERKEHFSWVEKLKLNHNQYRFSMFPISFSWNDWVEHELITPKEEMMIIHFNGREEPKASSASLEKENA